MPSATTEDLARLLVSIEFTQKQSAKQLEAIAKKGGGTAKKIEDDFKKANDNIAKGFEAGGQKSVQSLGAQRAAAQNLSFQLNDIATQLASGTSPFTVMAQQGGQVAQIINGAGGVRGAVGALGSALGSVLNPAGLVSIALIGLTGYAVQFFAEMLSGGEASEETLKKQADLIQRVAATYGDQIPVLKEYAAQLKNAADQAERLEGIKATKEGIASGLQKDFTALTEAQRDAISLVPDANREYTILAAKMESGSAEAADFQRVIDALNTVLANNTSPALTAARNALVDMQAASAEAARKAKELDKAAGAMNLTIDQAKTVATALTAQMTGLGAQGVSAIADIASAFTTNLIPQMGVAIDRVGELMKKYDELNKSFQQTPLNSLSPVFSGGGQFLNSDGDLLVSPFKDDSALRAAGESAAAKMIRGFESFISSAKWDVNAFRTGYGSDTTTRANGAIEKVTKDTVVSLDDAERDLARRIIEFQDGIQKAIGIDTWRSLNEAQQAALTSIAYNYGSLPKSIVAAIEGGGGPEVVAKAIAGLTANPGRRKEEAQAYLSGTGYSMGDVGLGSKKSPKDIFQGDIDQIQKRIDVLNAEYAAQAKLNPLVNDYGYAVEKARIEQELLSEAQKAGLEITPALKADIGTLAENYAKAASASDQLKESQKRAVESAQEFASLGKDVTKGFISDLRSGKSAAEAFAGALDTIADKLINLAIDGLFGGFGAGGLGGGGLLGGAIIPGILHSGGVAGSDGYGHGRAVSAGTFAGAKRYHKGGTAGLMPGEIPAILQRGEVVLPRGTKAGGGQAVHVTVGVSADSNGNLLPFVQDVSKKTVTEAAPKIVGAANQNVVPTMAKYQGQKAGGDYRTM